MDGWIWIIAAVIWGAIWGYIAYSIILKRGYDKKEAQKWEFIGFFLGFIGVILALTKPDLTVQQNMNMQQPQQTNADVLLKYKQLLDSGAITQQEFDMKKRELGFGAVNTSAQRSNPSGSVPTNSWRCSECGNINPNYVTTCRCGNPHY